MNAVRNTQINHESCFMTMNAYRFQFIIAYAYNMKIIVLHTLHT